MKSLLTTVILFILVSEASANGFRNPPDGGEGLGRIGGKTAQIDDPSAIEINPANLTDLNKPSFLNSATFVIAETKFESTAGPSTRTHDPVKILPSFFAALPFDDGKYVIGLGVTSPFGQSTVWGKQSMFRYTIPWYSALTVANINPTFAMKINESLSVGAGADFFLSRLEMRQYFPWVSVTGDPSDSDGEARLRADGFGMGGNVGATWKFAPHQRLAVTYRCPVDVEYDGHFSVSNRPPNAKLPPSLQGTTAGSGYHTGIEFPAILTLGYGIELSDTLRLGSDIEYVQFSSYQTLRTDIENNNVLLPARETLQHWKDIWTFGVGGDWKFKPGWVLRGGYQYLETPIPNETLSPTLPDSDKHVFSVGLGYTYKRHTLGMSYAATVFEDRVITNNQNPAFNGRYDLSSHLVALSYQFKF